MKNNHRYIKAALLLMLATAGCSLHAQQTLVTTPQAITIVGGDCSNASGSISASGGEVAVHTSVARAITVVNITASFSEGVQQPFTLRDKSLDIESPVCNLSVYPNPTTDAVNLEGDTSPLHYALYTLSGQQLQEGSFDGGTIRIGLENYAAGCYILRVISNDKKQTSVYKITLVK